MIYNVVLLSAVQQTESVSHMHTSIIFLISFSLLGNIGLQFHLLSACAYASYSFSLVINSYGIFCCSFLKKNSFSIDAVLKTRVVWDNFRFPLLFLFFIF